MKNTPQFRTTEEIAREVVEGLVHELADLMIPANDGRLAAYEMAEDKADEIRQTLRQVRLTIQNRKPDQMASHILDEMLRRISGVAS